MKKKILLTCVLAMNLALLSGCTAADNGTSTQETADTTSTESQNKSLESTTTDSEVGELSSEEMNAEGNYILPMDNGIDIDNLEDCTVAASFGEGDIYQDDAGVLQMNFTVYVYDLYDIVDIANLKVGDTIYINQADCFISSLETDDHGAIIINGGIENEGYDLYSDEESNCFYAVSWDDAKVYYELGNVTLPVSDEMTFEDSSDLDTGAVTYYAGDFLTDYEDIDYHFVPYNTTVEIAGGKVVAINRVYMP